MKITVPVYADYELREEYLREFERAAVDRILFVVDREFDRKKAKREAEKVKRCIDFYAARGFSCAVWIGSTIGHGVYLVNRGSSDSRDYTLIKGIDGTERGEAYCPLDENFRRDISEFIATLADIGAEFLLLDDDFRIAHDFIGCVCDRHLAEFEKVLGHPVTAAELKEKALGGKPNEYRKAWVKIQGDSLRLLARNIRAAVDKVNPDCPVGVCAVGTAWSADGVDSVEITEILAGRNKRYMRLHGAPYWVKYLRGYVDESFAHVTELERALAHFSEGKDIELMYEGDTYPRPSDYIPAAHLEAFHAAMIGDGKAQGMLKYMFNYISKPDFDRRYIEFHARNKANFDRIEKYFKGGANLGVKVLEHPHLFDETDFAFGRTDGAKFYFSSDVISGAGSLLIGAGIPTIYDGESDVCAIFGENARHFSIDGKPRAIIDALAAAICLEKGEDIGITGGELRPAPTDRVCGYGDEYRLPQGAAVDYLDFTPGDNVKVLTALKTSDGEIPLACEITTKSGAKILLYNVNANFTKISAASFLVRGYVAAKTLKAGVNDFLGAELPEILGEYADMQAYYRADGETLSCLFINFYDDPAFDFSVELPGEYEVIEAVGNEAQTRGKTLSFASPIPAFGYAFAALKRK